MTLNSSAKSPQDAKDVDASTAQLSRQRAMVSPRPIFDVYSFVACARNAEFLAAAGRGAGSCVRGRGRAAAPRIWRDPRAELGLRRPSAGCGFSETMCEGRGAAAASRSRVTPCFCSRASAAARSRSRAEPQQRYVGSVLLRVPSLKLTTQRARCRSQSSSGNEIDASMLMI